MFNIGKILERSWKILWSYKVLWIFALLLALSGGASNGGGGGGGSGYSSRLNDLQNQGRYYPGDHYPQWMMQAGDWFEQNIAPWFATEEKAIQTVIWMVVIIFAVSIVFGLLLALVRYPSETAVIRMADEEEKGGTRRRFKEAWKLGWNRRAWRMFLIDLLIGTPAFAVFALGAGLTVWMVLTFRDDLAALVTPGMVIGFVFFVLFIFAFALFMALVSLLRNYVVRYNALEDTGVWESFRRGWKLFKANFWRTVLMGLVLIGVSIAFGFAVMIAAVILIPAYALLALPGAIAAAIPGGIAYGITAIFSPGVLPWIIGALAAVPMFFLVVFLPLSFLGGMFAVYNANVWTLTFRQMQALSLPLPAEPPVLPEA